MKIIIMLVVCGGIIVISLYILYRCLTMPDIPLEEWDKLDPLTREELTVKPDENLPSDEWDILT